MDERLSRMEVVKDSVQELVEAGATTVGEIASIVTNAVGDVARACGEFATTAFEIRDGARAATAEDLDGPGDLDDLDDLDDKR